MPHVAGVWGPGKTKGALSRKPPGAHLDLRIAGSQWLQPWRGRQRPEAPGREGGAGIRPDVMGTQAMTVEVGEEGIHERDMWEVGWQHVGKGRRCILTPSFCPVVFLTEMTSPHCLLSTG